MARAMWTGALSFGLVNIPMRLFGAVKDERPHFHLLHAPDEAPVRYERICAREEKPVPWSEIVKGYEVSKGEHAVLTPEDFKRAALDRSETIDILAFVEAGAIDTDATSRRRITSVPARGAIGPTRSCARRCARRTRSPSRRSSFARRSTWRRWRRSATRWS